MCRWTVLVDLMVSVTNHLQTEHCGCTSAVKFVISYRCLSVVCDCCPVMVVSVAQLVARRTHDRKVVGTIPTSAVCFTVVR